MTRKRNTVGIRKTGQGRYRPVCIIATEGFTEQDYLKMDVFKDIPVSMKVVKKKANSGKSNPKAVLAQMKKALKGRTYRKGDQAWCVIDADDWTNEEINAVLDWAASRSHYHVAISNPKFELFLVVHFEDAKGCTTAAVVDRRLKKYMSEYKKRIPTDALNRDQVDSAIQRARTKRCTNNELKPVPGTTDAHVLVDYLFHG